MNIYLFCPETFEKLYNCTSYSIEKVPLEERRHVLIGSSFIILFFVFEMLYIPSLFVIYRVCSIFGLQFMNSHFRKLISLAMPLCITDVAALLNLSFLTGYFSIIGAVFCSFPNFNYIVGCVASVFWGVETCCAVLLALNRCLSLWRPSVCAFIFRKNKTWILIAPILAYSLFYGLFYMPSLYNSIYVAWMFNPHHGYIDDVGDMYINPLEAIHDSFVFFGICGLYITFVLLLVMKSAKFTSQQTRSANLAFINSKVYADNEINKRNAVQKAAFVQALLICSANACTAALFFWMALFDISDNILYVSTYMWCLAHGIPSVIYVFLNKTIRKKCLEMLFGKSSVSNSMRTTPKKQKQINSVHQHSYVHRTHT